MTKKLLKKAFTLVELIIVIAIVAILAVISFLWLNKWLGNARDASRKGNLANLDKALQIYLTEKTTLPKPDNNTMLYASGIDYIIGYQGYFGETVRDSIGNIDKAPKDGNNYFTYYVNNDLKKYQLMAYMENPVAYNPNTANAENYAQRYIYVRGDKLGILTDSDKNPLQDFGGTGFNVLSGENNYTAYYDNSTNIVLTGQSLISMMVLGNKNSAQFDTGLVGYWDMETTINSGEKIVLKDFSSYGNNGTCYDSGTAENCGTAGPTFVNESEGKSMEFDGVDDFIDFGTGNNNTFSLTTGMTISMKIKIIKQKRSRADIINKRSAIGNCTNWRLELGDISDYGYVFPITNPIDCSNLYGAGLSTQGNNKRKENEYSFLNITVKENDKAKIYYNGTLLKYGSIIGDISSTEGFHIFLANPNFPLERFNGTIDEVRIYNRALSDDEVKALYTATN